MIVRLEYTKMDGEGTILDCEFINEKINKRGESYFTVRCWDNRDNYRNIKPESIISVLPSPVRI